VPGAELLRALEEADDLAVLGVGGHAVPGPRGELRRAGLDQGMDPLRDDAVRFRHLGDLRQYLSLRVGLASRAATPRLQLLGALRHGGAFLIREARRRLRALLGGRLLPFSHLGAPPESVRRCPWARR